MARNRAKTEERILEAARDLIGAEGFRNWGVNHLARSAGVDKVLIYRYFTNMDGVYQQMVATTVLSPEATEPADLEAFLLAWWQHLRGDALGRQILYWRHTADFILETANLIQSEFRDGVLQFVATRPADPWADCLFSALCDHLEDENAPNHFRRILEVVPQRENSAARSPSGDETLPTELL